MTFYAKYSTIGYHKKYVWLSALNNFVLSVQQRSIWQFSKIGQKCRLPFLALNPRYISLINFDYLIYILVRKMKTTTAATWYMWANDTGGHSHFRGDACKAVKTPPFQHRSHPKTPHFSPKDPIFFIFGCHSQLLSPNIWDFLNRF
jgi:hypothetical protein